MPFDVNEIMLHVSATFTEHHHHHHHQQQQQQHDVKSQWAASIKRSICSFLQFALSRR